VATKAILSAEEPAAKKEDCDVLQMDVASRVILWYFYVGVPQA
jgi:hypothetical protein